MLFVIYFVVNVVAGKAYVLLRILRHMAVYCVILISKHGGLSVLCRSDLVTVFLGQVRKIDCRGGYLHKVLLRFNRRVVALALRHFVTRDRCFVRSRCITLDLGNSHGYRARLRAAKVIL